ncbi:protein kinase [Streptomyces zagrosensis]|uniref:Serine/threonine protein kinase n=1 Tax=Streptomyces zagrosensis TaxID=1042984 RepID=A0A7W9QG32_9ACTN|nr:protein kinase [Streptomyces zagrosensis]MBB5939625.1 serine/threonine protein kinase [Streptomyces zagrosensis]
MDDYAGRVLADRYRLPLPPADEYEFVETRAFDTYSGQEVLVRQVPLPEVVEAEMVGDGPSYRDSGAGPAGGYAAQGAYSSYSSYGSYGSDDGRPGGGQDTRRRAIQGSGLGDPAVRRAIDAATAAAQVPDHPRLDQVFHVFAESGSLWIVSELVPARPLAALLAERPLSPHRAAEVAADVLTALRALHAHGWTHRNITTRTVLVCDDGRAMLTGLAAGAAEEALCGYDPVPEALRAARAPQPRSPFDDAGLDPGAGYETPEPWAGGGAGAGDARVDVGAVPSPRPGTGSDALRDIHADTGPGAGGGLAAGGGSTAERQVGGGAGRDLAAERAERERARAREFRPGPEPDAAAAGAGALPATPVVRRGPAGPVYRNQEPAGRLPLPRNGHGGVKAGPAASLGTGANGGPGSGVRAGDAGGGAEHAGQGAPLRAPRAGAIAAYRAGAQAAARGSVEGGPAEGEPVKDGPAEAPQTHVRATGSHATGPGATGPYAAEPADEHTDEHTERAGQDWSSDDPPREHWADDGRELADTPPLGAAGGGSDAGGYRGPDSALAAERARQARIVVVGAITERWAPEQAGPVYENWRLAPPVGPAADLWAVGALLFRAVQGHAPYPEENAAELVQLVCAEPPAYAEECGALRPVVESLMRQDPTERPDFEELRGWLRSLIRSAPEPDVGSRTVMVPPTGPSGPADPQRLPILRRRGELVRRRRQAATLHGRHRHKRGKLPRVPRQHHEHQEPPPRQEKHLRLESHEAAAPRGAGERGPRNLGRWLVVLVLLMLAAAVLYAMVFMPEAKKDEGAGRGDSVSSGSGTPQRTVGAGDGKGAGNAEGKNGDRQPQSTDPTGLAKGFALRKDPEGFQLAVSDGWQRRQPNGRGQIRYLGNDCELIVVPGRDKVAEYGSDPMKYQQVLEPELAPFRNSEWASATGLRRIDVGETAMAEGAFGWNDSSGRKAYARNLAMIIQNRYHIVQVIGPDNQRRAVDRYFDQASASYRSTR